MPRTARAGGFSKNSPSSRGSTASLTSSVLCSKKGLIFSIGISLIVYFLVFQFQWSTSDTRFQAGQFHQSEQFQDKHEKPGTVKDPVAKELEQRRKLYEEKCIQRKESYVWELFAHPPSKLSVCHVPKAGCTFWKRLFRYLTSEHLRPDISSPFDIDRVQAHYGSPTSLLKYHYHTPEGRLVVDASTKVMMVRSPYRRLWSAYLDKFFLPEWWLDHGKSIMYARKEKERMKTCPDNISFEEFLEYSLRNHEQHWRPITELCDPCTYKPKFIGHVDTTFMRDVSYILNTQGLGSLLAGYNENNHLTNDIENLLDYHNQLYQQRQPLRDCLSEKDLAVLLWKVLKINGYYKMDHAFPREQIEEAFKDASPKQVRDSSVDIFLQEFRQNPNTEQAWRTQREAIFEEAYRNVSDITKNKIVHRYYNDFDMFGFDTAFPGSEK